jgi:hypothetical protein
LGNEQGKVFGDRLVGFLLDLLNRGVFGNEGAKPVVGIE